MNSLPFRSVRDWLCLAALAGFGVFTAVVPASVLDHLPGLAARLPVGDPTQGDTFESGPKAIGTADLDGDGKPDLAVSNKDGSVTLYFGRGDGTFAGPQHLQTGGDELRGLICADFTSDGKPDIAVAAPYQSVVYLFVNQGSRQFAGVAALPAWRGVHDLVNGDFDGDGVADLAVAGTDNGVAHWRGAGDGTFTVLTNITSLGEAVDNFPQPAYYLRTFRPTGLSRDELVMGRAKSNRVRILSADLSGRLTVIGVLTNLPVNSLATGPIIRPRMSEVPDLVVAHNDRGYLEVHAFVGGTNRFNQAPVQRIDVPGGPRAIQIADLDGDGWNDVIVVVNGFNRVQVFRNQAGRLVPGPTQGVGDSPREMVVGDFNQDTYPDAAVLNRFSSDISILLTWPGSVGFGTFDGVYPTDGLVSGLGVGDLDGDDRDDVVQLHYYTAEVSVRLAQTNGSLGAPVLFRLPSKASAMTMADVNHDGVPDVLTANDGGSISVLLGQGNGRLHPARTFRMPADATGRLFVIHAANLDGDGHLDVVAGYWDCRVAFFRGDGAGHFQFTRVQPMIYEPRAVTSGDLDGDGHTDVVLCSVAGKFAVVKNLGDILVNGNSPITTYPSSHIGGSRDAALFHANNDLHLDLLIAGWAGAPLFPGTNGGGFGELSLLSTQRIASILLGDIDVDGTNDLLLGHEGRSCITLYSRGEDGSYHRRSQFGVPASDFILSGDVDGDHLPDLVGSGEVLWVALSSGPPQRIPPRPTDTPPRGMRKPVINELLALNTAVPLDTDGGRRPDWIEVFNGLGATQSFAGWRLRLVCTNAGGVVETNQFNFPSVDVGVSNHLIVVCSETLRTPLHTGFNLPAEGGELTLLDAAGEAMDQLFYPRQQENLSWSRYSDGEPEFVTSNFPTPGRPNADNGRVPPELSFDEVDYLSARTGQPIRFYATSRDDVGVINVTVVWRRLDIADGTDHRVVLFDDGMNGDAGLLDGYFSGVLEEPLPAGAQIQFYLECTDLTGQMVTEPGDNNFAAAGESTRLFALTVGEAGAPLEVSEIVASNQNGLRDETGGTPDWIEIRNCGSAPVSLDGLLLAPRLFSDGNQFNFPTNITLAPGQNLIVFCDNNPTNGPLHAPFTLDPDEDQIVLLKAAANGARTSLDGTRWRKVKTDRAWARLGCGGPWRVTTPTPALPNVSGAWETLLEPGRFTLGFPTVNGQDYVIESTDSLPPPDWTPRPAVRGTGLEHSISEPMQPQRYYRVRPTP